jgi:hypothetical protein
VNKEAAAEKAKAAAEKSIAEATRVAGAAKKKNDGTSRAPHKGANLDAEKSNTEGAPKGKLSSPMSRPVPIWWGPMMAAGRWGELGADSKELAAPRYGVMDRPNRSVSPFRLPLIRLDEADSHGMGEVIEKRLVGRIWDEISATEARAEEFLSREFNARYADGKPLSVGAFGHLSDHYDRISTKNETLEGFSASLLPGDRMLTRDLKVGYNHFRLHKDMRRYFVVSVALSDGSVRYFRYIVLPFGWSRSGYWYCRLVNRFWTMVKHRYRYRVCRYVDDFAVVPSVGRPATEADCLKASAKLDKLLIRYGLTRHQVKGMWNGGGQVLTHLGFMIDTVRGIFGVPATKLSKVEALARRLLRMERSNARRVPARDLASFIGRAQSLRLAVPDTAFRPRALYDPLHGQTDSDPGHGDYLGSSGVRASRHVPRNRVRLSHPALRDLAYWATCARLYTTAPSGPSRRLRQPQSIQTRQWKRMELLCATGYTELALGVTTRSKAFGSGSTASWPLSRFKS